MKALQVPFGFIGEVFKMTRRSDVKNIETGKKKFAEDVKNRLAEHGIIRKLSKEDVATKGKAMKSILFGLGKTFVPKPETKITEVYGREDLTTMTPSVRKERGHEGSLGEDMLERPSPNRRRFGAKMGHLNPWFRENELRRMDKLGKTLESLKKRE